MNIAAPGAIPGTTGGFPTQGAFQERKLVVKGQFAEYRQELQLVMLIGGLMFVAKLSHGIRPLIAGLCGLVFINVAMKRLDIAICMIMLYLVAPPLVETKSLLGIPGLNPDTVMVGIMLYSMNRRMNRRKNAPGDIWLRKRINPLTIPMAVWILLIIESAAQTPLTSNYGVVAALQIAKSYVTYMFMLWIVVEGLEKKKDMLVVFTGFLLTLGFLTGYGLRDTIVHMGSGRFRLDTFFGQANEVGGFLAMYLPLVITAFLAPQIEKKFKTMLIPLIFTCSVSLIFTLSRGSILSAMGGMVILGTIYSRRFMIFMIFCGVTYPIWVPDRLIERFAETTEDIDASSKYGLDGSTEVRIQQWAGIPDMTYDTPLLGHGLCSFRYVYRDRVSGKLKDSHSSWVEIMVEQGAIGIISILTLMAFIALLSWRVMKGAFDFMSFTLGPGLLTSVAVIIVVNCDGDRLHNPIINAYFWVMCGLLVLSYNEILLRPRRGKFAADGADPKYSLSGFQKPQKAGERGFSPTSPATGKTQGLRSASLAGFFRRDDSPPGAVAPGAPPFGAPPEGNGPPASSPEGPGTPQSPPRFPPPGQAP